ncbi:MAG: hypothetical protein R2690_14565 [Acidimicrobiales bacterium]
MDRPPPDPAKLLAAGRSGTRRHPAGPHLANLKTGGMPEPLRSLVSTGGVVASGAPNADD